MSSADVARAIEEHLVREAQAGDTTSFEALVRRHIDRLYGAARLMLRDTDLAEDAVQVTLVRAWRDLPSLRQPDRFEAWLQKLLVRACYDEVRRKRRWAADIRVVDGMTRTGVVATTDIGERDRLERGFKALSQEHRAILVLHFYLDLPVVEIATRLNVPAGTARSRLHYALGSLRAALDAQERADHRSAGTVA